MVTTTAFQGLLELISVIGSFVTSKIIFGVSFLQLLIVSYCIHHIIGICLGGSVPRSSLETIAFKSRGYQGVREVNIGKYDRIAHPEIKESYKGGGKY